MNRMTRDAILRGVGGASEAQDAFRLREKHGDGLSAINVFELIDDLQIPLHFLPLDGLLGTCIRVNSAAVGILVTTQRDLHMQRFTAAHEMGHFVLEHEADSLDREIRMPGHTDGREPLEVEADAFAAEFLMPKWLVKATAERRGWWEEEALKEPSIVYQLSLRLGVSFEATCWTLASHEYIERAAAAALVGNGKQVKEAKRRALGGVALDDPWADVWQLSAADSGARIDAGPNDVFVIDLDERAAAGFRWDARDAVAIGFEVLRDDSAFGSDVVGGSSRRHLVFRAPPAGVHHLSLPLRRSFSKSTEVATFQVAVSTIGARKSTEFTTRASAPPTMH